MAVDRETTERDLQWIADAVLAATHQRQLEDNQIVINVRVQQGRTYVQVEDKANQKRAMAVRG